MVVMHFYKSLANVCFSDFDVLRVNINQTKKIFQIDLEGIWLLQNEDKPKELGQGYIKISDFKEIKAKFFNSVKKVEGDASIQQIKELKEINVHEVENDSLKISGFINDGSWLECEIVGGKVEGKFAE